MAVTTASVPPQPLLDRLSQPKIIGVLMAVAWFPLMIYVSPPSPDEAAPPQTADAMLAPEAIALTDRIQRYLTEPDRFPEIRHASSAANLWRKTFELWRNLNGKKFEKVKLPTLPTSVSKAACWGDFNGDGFADLYVGGFENFKKR